VTAPACPPRLSATDPWRSHPTRIVSILDETPGVRTYELAFEEAAVRAGYGFASGQFNMLYLPGIGEAAISVSSDPDHRGTIAHTVRAVGNVTDALARLAVGEQVLVRGPFGTPWPIDGVAGRDIVIVAGGLGLASQRAAIRQLTRRTDGGRTIVLHGAKRPEGLLYAAEYDLWRASGIDVLTVVDEGDASWTGRVGLVTHLLADLPLDPSATTILCCGPDAMMTDVAKAAMSRGVSAEHVFLSLERNMACAVAHCGLCQFGPHFVCRDGPVLRYDRIAGLMQVPQL
jgi:NAD(P)H-flavin reductase